MSAFTPKQRMLNAYRGVWSDRYPVAPEFWYYYPAKVLGVDMVTFERQSLLIRGLKATFAKYGTEGWGAYYSWPRHPEAHTQETFQQEADGRFLLTHTCRFRNHTFTAQRSFDRHEPSWSVRYPVQQPGSELGVYLDMQMPETLAVDVRPASEAYREVGDAYLLEFMIGSPFFDFVAGPMGFEAGIAFFMADENQALLQRYQQRYIEFLGAYIAQVCPRLPYEAYFMGCTWSCNSLIGPHLWRRWEKPVLRAVADTLHRHGKLLHIHLHGKCMETASDLAELGIDCVCPFERPPGGDVTDLPLLRRQLADRVTMNGNVHTVETLIRGTPADVRREVREILAAYRGSPRLIVGTGDQVGLETPEENIDAMVDEVRQVRPEPALCGS